MKKLTKLELVEKAEFLNKREMKLVVGGYSGSSTCGKTDGKCSGTCPPVMGGGSQTCTADKTYVPSQGETITVCMCR